MKENERLKKIRDYLLKHGKATWTDISTATNKQPKELASDLRKLIASKEITTEQDRKDRRKTWYMLRDKTKALAEVKRYDASEFLDSLKNPLSFEITIPKGKFQAHISVFAEAKGYDPEKERKSLELMAMQTKKSLEDSSINFWQPGTFDKIVLFFAVEEKGVKKNE